MNWFINCLCSSIIIPNVIRKRLYRLAGLKIRRARIYPRCFFGSKNIEIGDGSFINYNCFFDTSAHIEIGKNVHFGMGVMLVTSSHSIGSEECRAGQNISAPIIIEDGCWIGANSVVLGGGGGKKWVCYRSRRISEKFM